MTCGCAQSSKPPFVSYPIHKKTLGNGLDVVVIETPEFAGVLSYNMMILAGSRNETEKGQSGLAHLLVAKGACSAHVSKRVCAAGPSRVRVHQRPFRHASGSTTYLN